MPQTIDFEGFGLSIDFPDSFTKDQINSWLEDNFDKREREWKRQVLTNELSTVNKNSRPYGAGLRWLNSIGSLASGYLGGVVGGAQTMIRKGPEFQPLGMGVAGRGNMWAVEKALGFNPFDRLADSMRKVGHEIDEVTQLVPVNEMGKTEKFFSEDVSSALGSGLFFISGGWALRGAMTANQAAMTLGAMQGYSSGYNRAIDAGETDDMANFMGLLNAGVGMSEALPVGRWIDRVNGKMGWSLGALLRESAEEAAQEFFQSGMEDAIAAIGKEDINLMETLQQALHQGLVGAVSGAALAGGTMGVGAARGRTQETALPGPALPGERLAGAARPGGRIGRRARVGGAISAEQQRGLQAAAQEEAELTRQRQAGILTQANFERQVNELRQRTADLRRVTPVEGVRPPSEMGGAPALGVVGPAGLLEHRPAQSGDVFTVDEAGQATRLDAEKHASFVAAGEEFRAEADEDLAIEGATEGFDVISPQERRSKRLAKARAKIESQRASANLAVQSPDYGGRGGLVEHGLHNGLIRQDVPFQGNNTVNRAGLDRVINAFETSLTPQNDNESRMLQEFLAKRRRTDQQNGKMAALDVEQFNQPTTRTEAKLFDNYMLANWVRAMRRMVEVAEEGGDEAGAERMRAQMADQFGLQYDPQSQRFPGVYNRSAIHSLTVDRSDPANRDQIEQAYPVGTLVQISDQSDPDAQATGLVVGYQPSVDRGLDLMVVTADGKQLRVNSSTAQVVDSPELGTKGQYRGVKFGKGVKPKHAALRVRGKPIEAEEWSDAGAVLPFTLSMGEWTKESKPVAVTLDLTKPLPDQGLRETQFSYDDYDTILQSLGITSPTSKREAQNLLREARKAALLLQKSDSTVDKEVPGEQLDDWAELYRVDGWKRRAKKIKKIQKLRRAVNNAVNARTNKAKTLSYVKAVIDSAMVGKRPSVQVVQEFNKLAPDRETELAEAMQQGEQLMGARSVDPAIYDAFEPEFRDGIFRPLKKGDKIPIVFGGYYQTDNDHIDAWFDWVGNWQLPDGRQLNTWSTTLMDPQLEAQMKEHGIELSVVKIKPAALEEASLEKATASFLQSMNKDPVIRGTIDVDAQMFSFDEDGIDVVLEEGGDHPQKESLNEWTRRTTFKGPNPVWIKPTYDLAGQRENRIGFAMVGYSARDTQQLEADDLAKKHDANVIRRVEPVTGALRQEPGEMEVFKPSVYVVMWDENSRAMGHYRFTSIEKAKDYLRERLHDDGVRTVRARRPINFEEIPKAEAPAAPPPGQAGVVEPQVVGPPEAGPFVAGTQQQVPMVNYTTIRSRPDLTGYEIVGPLDVYPGVVRVRDVVSGVETDIHESMLTTPTQLTPLEVIKMQQLSGFLGKSRVTQNPMGFHPGNLESFSREDRSKMVAMQTPINVPVGQLLTMSRREVQSLANRESFGDVALLGLRVGRHLKSPSHLNFVRGYDPQFEIENMLKSAILAGATGSAAGLDPRVANQFAILRADMTYIPPHEAEVEAGREGFTREGLPARVQERRQDATVKTPLQVLSREGDKVTTRDLVSGEIKDHDAAELETQESPDVQADTGVLKFESDLREAGESSDEIMRKLQRAPRKMRRVANSHVPLAVPAKSFKYYIAEDFIQLADQEGQGDMVGVAYRVGRNLTSITEFNRLLEMRRENADKAQDATVSWDYKSLTDTRRLNNVINEIGWENLTDADRASLVLSGFIDPAIEAATGLSPNLGFSKTPELWSDPTYVPPFQCASPCNRNQDPQPGNTAINPPASTSTPDTEAAQQPAESARWKNQPKKRTKSVQYLLLDEKWVKAHPHAFKELSAGTYSPRSWAELRSAAGVVVDAWDDGVDGLRELAQSALSSDIANKWWNVTEDLKPAVLVEIAERLNAYANTMKSGAAAEVIGQLEANIWHNVQEIGSMSGQMLNTFRMLASSLNKQYFINKVVRRMFEKAEAVDAFEAIKPQLEKQKELLDKAPAGTPKERMWNEISKTISKAYPWTKSDKFWSMWYNNVLSSLRTQFDNATMALNVVVETGLNMAIQPGSAVATAKGLLSGFRYGISRFGEIMKGDYSGRLADPYELQGKFAKDPIFSRSRPDPLKAMAESEKWWQRGLSKVQIVTHLMSAIDNVVMQGGYDVRVQMRAWQMARDELAKKAEAYAKAGKPWVVTKEQIEELKDEILKTTPEHKRRYREQANREVEAGDIQANERDIRVAELTRLGHPNDIIEDARQYGRQVTGTNEPRGLSGKLHHIIANNKSKPNAVGYTTRAVFPFTRWAANWTNIITDYMPPIGLARMFIYSPNTNWAEKWAGKLKVAPKTVQEAQKFLLSADKVMGPTDYQLLRARAVAGMAFATSAYAAFSLFDDDDEPFLRITGGMYNLSPQRRAQLRETGIFPWSIVIGGKSIAYRNWPIAGAMGVVGNMKDADRYGGDEQGLMWKMANAVFRGSFMIQDMSVLAGAADLLDIITNNRYNAEFRIRSLGGWAGRFTQGIVPLSNFQRDAEAVIAQIWERPQVYNPTTGWGMFFRDWPLMQRISKGQPALNVLGETVNVERWPWSRMFYPRRNDPMWDSVGIKAQQGVFLPSIVSASVTDPTTGDKKRMSETDEYRYKAEVYKRLGDVMRYNHRWFRDAEPESAQLWLDRMNRQIRESVRYELGLQ